MNASQPTVTVVDYGAGNILSVTRALAHVGALATVSDDPVVVARADRILLPGVGAFGKAMDELAKRRLIEPLRAYAASGRPFLGICLGMQLMLEESAEFGRQEGLGLIAGKVQPIPAVTATGEPHKIPHIGWNALIPAENGAAWSASPLAGMAPDTAVYFVHSFGVYPARPEHTLAECDYGGCRFAAAVMRDNIVGFQFHPEKSGAVGLAMIRGFIGTA